MQPPDRNRAAPPSTPPEVCRPSGGVIAGVRSTRDYHPRHLPPLVFLKPSTAYSSRRLTYPVSYRHHLWDSKNTNRFIASLVFLTGLSEDSPVRDYEARNDHLPESRMITELSLLVARHSARMKRLSVACLRVTHPNFLQAVRQGGRHFNKLLTSASGSFFSLCAPCVDSSLTRFSASSQSGRRANRAARAPKKNSRRAPVPQVAPTAPTSEPQQLHIPKELHCTVRSLLVHASICSKNNLSTPSCDFASRSPSALRHSPAASTRCE